MDRVSRSVGFGFMGEYCDHLSIFSYFIYRIYYPYTIIVYIVHICIYRDNIGIGLTLFFCPLPPSGLTKILSMKFVSLVFALTLASATAFVPTSYSVSIIILGYN